MKRNFTPWFITAAACAITIGVASTRDARADDDPLLNPPPKSSGLFVVPKQPIALPDTQNSPPGRAFINTTPSSVPAPSMPPSVSGPSTKSAQPITIDSAPLPSAPGTLAPSVPAAAAPGAPAVAAPGTATAPASPGEAPVLEGCQNCQQGFNFSKVPDVKGLLTGYNFPQPTGPGYYSVQDVLDGNYRSAAPKYGYYQRNMSEFRPFFEADFRYLDDPNYTEDRTWSERLKRIKIGDDWMLSTGGQAWNRFWNVTNQGGGTARGVQDLARIRTYADIWYQDIFRFYGEFIAAGNYTASHYTPAATDINTADFLNLFVDVKLFALDGHNFYGRVGRQEMALGSQRLISTLDFANTRRTFEGVRGTYRGESWDYDIWWLRPVVPNPYRLDSWDDKQDFVGSWATYHPNKTDVIDMYYLYLDNQNNTTTLGLTRAPQATNTLGARYAGNHNGFLWEFENMFQFGSQQGAGVIAGASTSGIGYNFKDTLWNPTFWAYYDFASGTQNATSKTQNTFNQLFPFGHLYLGGLDFIGRQNINDFNLHWQVNPTPYLSFWTQYHHLWLDSATDALYNSAGVAIRRSATGAAGTDVGDILNFITNIHLTQTQDLQVGYGHLFGGEFMKKTGTSNMDYTYVSWSIKW